MSTDFARRKIYKTTRELEKEISELTELQRANLFNSTRRARQYLIKAQDEVIKIMRETDNQYIKDYASQLYELGIPYRNGLVVLNGSLLTPSPLDI